MTVAQLKVTLCELGVERSENRCLKTRILQAMLQDIYAVINRARGPYEEIFVLTFKEYGSNAVTSMRLECQNK